MAVITPMGRKLPTIRPDTPPKTAFPRVSPAPAVAARTSPGSVPPKLVAPGAPTRTVSGPAPVIPQWTPGALDPDAQRAQGDITSRLRILTGLDPQGNAISGSIGQYQAQRDEALRQARIGREDATLARDQGLEADDSGAAARGFFQSGVRLDDRAKTVAAAQRVFDRLTEQENIANAQFKSNMDTAWADYQTTHPTIVDASNQRSYTNWLDTQAPPTPAATAKVFTYPQWLAYHAAAKTKLPTGPALKARYEAYVSAHTPK